MIGAVARRAAEREPLRHPPGHTWGCHPALAKGLGAGEQQDAVDEAGIEVPFPQTDLRIRSLFGREGDEAIAAMLGQHLAKQADTGTPSSRPSQPTAPAMAERISS